MAQTNTADGSPRGMHGGQNVTGTGLCRSRPLRVPLPLPFHTHQFTNLSNWQRC